MRRNLGFPIGLALVALTAAPAFAMGQKSPPDSTNGMSDPRTTDSMGGNPTPEEPRPGSHDLGAKPPANPDDRADHPSDAAAPSPGFGHTRAGSTNANPPPATEQPSASGTTQTQTEKPSPDEKAASPREQEKANGPRNGFRLPSDAGSAGTATQPEH